MNGDSSWNGSWARTPRLLGKVHGIVRHGARWFLCQQEPDAPAVVELADDGSFVRAWGEEFGAGAHGLSLDGDTLWLTDERGRVVHLTLDGRIIAELAAPRDGWKPTEVAVAPDGRRYVADGYGSSFIDVYDGADHLIGRFGGPAERGFSRCKAWEDPGRLEQPHGLRVLRRLGTWEVLVADRRRNRLQAFTLDGEHAGFLHGGVRYPCTVAAWGDDRLVVPDLYACVHVLDHHGRSLAVLGDNAQAWDQPGWPDLPWRPHGRFIAPHCVWADPDGSLTVGEWTRPGRVVRLISTTS